MERTQTPAKPSLIKRAGTALRLLFNRDFAQQVVAGLEKLDAPMPVLPPERVHAPGLVLLAALQREGRLIDFLQQDVATYSDEEIGAAARVVHGGCRKTIQQYFELEPAAKETEGASVTIPKGFDAQRTRLTGNVAGEPPFRGTLKHHGWVVKTVRLPEISNAIDPRVIAPAEVELA